MTDSTSGVDGTLLVPIANRETADRQLDTAMDIAADREYRILLVFVLSVPSQLSLVDGRRYLLEDENEELLEDAAARVESQGIPVERRIRMARGVAVGIVGAVDKHEADAVLMGWRGRPPRQNVILGGYVDDVLTNANCDVLVKRIKTPTPEPIESILLPVGGGPHSQLAAETAASIARRNDSSVTLLHVLETDAPEDSREKARGLLTEAATRFDDDRQVDRELVSGTDVAGTITDWTADHDVTVLGVSEGGLIERRLLGTVSEGVGRHAAGTVILTRRYDPVPSRLRRLIGK